ncbi:MAG: hypothetical protein KW793_03605 [Candidatus Doudnabacteria bacterium]|nr:hypothetical protein [Candidatus Doudnabacteria bacterium]
MSSVKHPSIIKLKDRAYFRKLEEELVKHGNVKVTGHGVFKLKRVKLNVFNAREQKHMGEKEFVRMHFYPAKDFKQKIQAFNPGKKVIHRKRKS